MALRFTHGDFTMSYGGFEALLEALAREAGIHLPGMERYGGERSWEDVDDPLVPFFVNRDEYGGGWLTAEQCLAASRRMRELADRWSDERRDKPHTFKSSALKTAGALAEAAFLGERFEWY